jgi:hypothetical protein
MSAGVTGGRKAARILVTAAAVWVSAVLVLFSFIATQGMSSKESLASLILFFSSFFAVAIGLPAVCTTIFTSKERALRIGCAYTAGGAIGGAFMALALKGLDKYDSELRTLTSGGPTVMFLVAAVPVSIICAVAAGALLQNIAKTRSGK